MKGHTYQRGKTWTYVVDDPRAPDGERRQLTKGGFSTEREARRALNQVMVKLDRGTFTDSNKETVGTFMAAWLQSIRASGIRESTWAGYQNLVEKHVVPGLGQIPLQKLTPAHLNAFYGQMLESGRRDGKGGLSPRTVLYTHATIRKALAEGVRWQVLEHNVADLATPPKQRTRNEPRTWSVAEVNAFLQSVSADRLFASFRLIAFTGLRRGEALGLRWRDIDLERGMLALTNTLITVNYKVQFSTPKTAAGRRAVAIDPQTVEVLKEHRRRQVEERTATGISWPNSDTLVFTDVEGNPLHPDQYSERFDRLVKRAQLPRIRLHDMRHTHATLMLAAGIHPKVVQERLGHSDISVTLQTYSHVLSGMQEDAASRFATLLEKSG